MRVLIFDKRGILVAEYSSEEYVIINEVNEISRHEMFHSDCNIADMRKRILAGEDISKLFIGFAPKDVSEKDALKWAHENRSKK